MKTIVEEIKTFLNLINESMESSKLQKVAEGFEEWTPEEQQQAAIEILQLRQQLSDYGWQIEANRNESEAQPRENW